MTGARHDQELRGRERPLDAAPEDGFALEVVEQLDHRRERAQLEKAVGFEVPELRFRIEVVTGRAARHGVPDSAPQEAKARAKLSGLDIEVDDRNALAYRTVSNDPSSIVV